MDLWHWTTVQGDSYPYLTRIQYVLEDGFNPGEPNPITAIGLIKNIHMHPIDMDGRIGPDVIEEITKDTIELAVLLLTKTDLFYTG